MTIVELAVAMLLLTIAATIYLGTMTSVYSGVNRQQRRSEINDQARSAMEQIDREVRSGNFILDSTTGNYRYDPATDVFAAPTCGGYACAANFSFRVYTQANATTRTPATQCVQYLVTAGNQSRPRALLRRSWVSGAATSSAWQTIATDVVNRDVSPTIPAFAMNTSGSRTLDVTLVVNNRLGQSDAPRTVRIETSVAMRNYGSNDPCSPIPTSTS
jgi:type II secretory pathway pseudopilin PulG